MLLMPLENAVGGGKGAELAVAGAGTGIQADVGVNLRLAVAELRGEGTPRLLDGEGLSREVLNAQQRDDFCALEQVAIECLVDDFRNGVIHRILLARVAFDTLHLLETNN